MPDLIKSKTFGVSLDQIDPFCLHWSCSPSTVNGEGGPRDQSRESNSFAGKMDQNWSKSPWFQNQSILLAMHSVKSNVPKVPEIINILHGNTFGTQTMIFDQKRCDEAMRKDFWWIPLVSSSIGSWVIKVQRIEAENKNKTIVHCKTVVLMKHHLFIQQWYQMLDLKDQFEPKFIPERCSVLQISSKI